MKVKIPRKLRFGCHPTEVRYETNLWLDEKLLGYSQRREQYISVDPVMPPSERDVTFIHEVVHNGDRIYHFGIDEDTIDRIAQFMGEFLFNNLQIKFDWDDIT